MIVYKEILFKKISFFKKMLKLKPVLISISKTARQYSRSKSIKILPF